MSQCTAVTRDPTGWGHRYPCTYKAKMQHEGKGYCGIHDPVKKAAREAERKAKYDARLKRSDERQHKLDTWDGLYDTMMSLLSCKWVAETGGTEVIAAQKAFAAAATKPPSSAGVGT